MMLETTTPCCFTYKADELLIELLGIRTDRLDAGTIKVTVINRKQQEYLSNVGFAGLSVRYNPDVYI
ncbi:MAG TPA: hypothetical protein VHN59_09275 [Chitinophagaceae bacterium]|nr:hypothetical protein [Chitinophagaceae bacterium]